MLTQGHISSAVFLGCNIAVPFIAGFAFARLRQAVYDEMMV